MRINALGRWGEGVGSVEIIDCLLERAVVLLAVVLEVVGLDGVLQLLDLPALELADEEDELHDAEGPPAEGVAGVLALEAVGLRHFDLVDFVQQQLDLLRQQLQDPHDLLLLQVLQAQQAVVMECSPRLPVEALQGVPDQDVALLQVSSQLIERAALAQPELLPGDFLGGEVEAGLGRQLSPEAFDNFDPLLVEHLVEQEGAHLELNLLLVLVELLRLLHEVGYPVDCCQVGVDLLQHAAFSLVEVVPDPILLVGAPQPHRLDQVELGSGRQLFVLVEAAALKHALLDGWHARVQRRPVQHDVGLHRSVVRRDAGAGAHVALVVDYPAVAVDLGRVGGVEQVAAGAWTHGPHVVVLAHGRLVELVLDILGVFEQEGRLLKDLLVEEEVIGLVRGLQPQEGAVSGFGGEPRLLLLAPPLFVEQLGGGVDHVGDAGAAVVGVVRVGVAHVGGVLRDGLRARVVGGRLLHGVLFVLEDPHLRLLRPPLQQLDALVVARDEVGVPQPRHRLNQRIPADAFRRVLLPAVYRNLRSLMPIIPLR